MQNELARLFGFEIDFAGSLRCIPMAVRFKLDVVGVKLGLKDWSRMTTDERHELLSWPFDSPASIDAFRARLLAMVVASGGTPPPTLPFDDAPAWRTPLETPSIVRTQAAACGIDLPTEGWARLSTLRRFTLCKLSRQKHDNANFLPALREFGLVPA